MARKFEFLGAQAMGQENLNFLAHILCANKLEFYVPRKLEFIGTQAMCQENLNFMCQETQNCRGFL